MSEMIKELIQALREELQQYGELLALLDQQQEFVVARAAEEVLQTVTSIQSCNRAVEARRAHRDELRRALALGAGQPEAATFSELLPHVPEDYRPLVRALVEENNSLLVRLQQRARQNHLLLSRSVELLQRFMSTLLPVLNPRVYNDAGTVLPKPVVVQSLYEAVG
jgi:flagellar biosynthesis/type III secretory pathway chaperone